MHASVRLFEGRTAILATMHGKEAAIAPVFREKLGLDILVSTGLDTDQLGTFTGEVERPAGMDEVLARKAELGLCGFGHTLAIASEGAYGPHPLIPFLGAGLEKLILIDKLSGLRATEFEFDPSPCFHSLDVTALSRLDEFLNRIDFPNHALIIRPLDPATASSCISKGIQDRSALHRALDLAIGQSCSGRARLETDMRAHMNPTRMATIARLAARFAERLARPCPACATPGWGKVDVEKGLPCSACGGPSERVRYEIFGCFRCPNREKMPRSDRLLEAGPRDCGYCNP